MLAMRCKRNLVEHAHQHGRDDKGEMDDDVPHELVVGDFLRIHKGAQQALQAPKICIQNDSAKFTDLTKSRQLAAADSGLPLAIEKVGSIGRCIAEQLRNACWWMHQLWSPKLQRRCRMRVTI